MSILTKLKANKLKKLINKHINAPTVTNIVEGVVDDVINKRYPNDTPLGIGYTLGDLNSIGGFYKVDWIVNDMIAVAIGRSTRLISLKVLTEQELINPDIILPMLQQTDQLQQQLVKPIINRLVEIYGNQSINSTKEQEVYDQWNSFQQLFN